MKLWLLLFSFLWLQPASLAGAAVLVELYTSQGCSSCPPADKFAGVLKEKKGVIVLTLPVTYWDRLGWKDSLASPKFTARQRAYARAMGERQVYTPQMVIDGKVHAVGSSRRKVYRLIEERLAENKGVKTPATPRVEILLAQTKQGATLSIPAQKTKKPLRLWRVDFLQKKSVAIGRGENSGRTITYYNVARKLTPLRWWRGEALTQKLKPLAGSDGIAIFLQEKNVGAVLASTAVLLK